MSTISTRSMKADAEKQLCSFCNGEAKDKIAIRLKNENVRICEDCRSFLLMRGVRLSGEIMVVPVKKRSLDMALQHRVYVRPHSKNATHPVMIAFYHNDEVRYLGKVVSLRKRIDKEEVMQYLADDNWGKKAFYTLYETGFVDELEKPIGRDSKITIQSKILVPFERFAKAKTIADLYCP